MRIFVGVVAAGSFSAAGRQLDVSPSGVSRRINELEEALGARLFHRTTRKLSLTEAGQIYYDRAAPIIMAVDEAKLAVSELGSPTGILRVTVPTGIGREVVVSAIPGFLDRFPGVKVVLSMTDHIVDIVEGGIDVAIRVGNLADSSLRARKIGESPRVVCASPDTSGERVFRRRPSISSSTTASRGESTPVRTSGSFVGRTACPKPVSQAACSRRVPMSSRRLPWQDSASFCCRTGISVSNCDRSSLRSSCQTMRPCRERALSGRSTRTNDTHRRRSVRLSTFW